MADQTVEDLGKLVKSKYPDAYGNMSDVEVGQKVKAQYPDAYGHFADIPAPTPESYTHSVARRAIENFVPSFNRNYNPFGQGSQYTPRPPDDPNAGYTPGSSLHNLGLNLRKDITEGAQGLWNTVRHPIESFAQDPLTTANVLGGGARAAFEGGKVVTPNIKSGFQEASKGGMYRHSLPTLVGAGISEATGHGYVPGAVAGNLISRIPAFVRGMRQGPKVEPPPTAKYTGPKLSDLSAAVKSGSKDMNWFREQAAKIPDMDPEMVELKAQTLEAQTNPSGKTVLGGPKKPLNESQLKQAFKMGEITPEELDQDLTNMGYDERARRILPKLWKGSDEEVEEPEIAKSVDTSKLKVESPKKTAPKPNAPKVESPKTSQQEWEAYDDKGRLAHFKDVRGEVSNPSVNLTPQQQAEAYQRLNPEIKIRPISGGPKTMTPAQREASKVFQGEVKSPAKPKGPSKGEIKVTKLADELQKGGVKSEDIPLLSGTPHLDNLAQRLGVARPDATDIKALQNELSRREDLLKRSESAGGNAP
jgi:hypothetical protein